VRPKYPSSHGEIMSNFIARNLNPLQTHMHDIG
jgi:hypothetical protein